jgi:uncharacterized membrane protein YbhN (UPF0104 family)
MPAMSTPRRKRAWLGGLLRVAGSVAILLLIFWFVPFGEAWQALRRLPALVWLGVLTAYFVTHLIGVNKYRLVLNSAGSELNFARAARCYFAGLFGMLFLPSVIGGDLLKAGLALRLARSKAGVLLGSVLDRGIDVAALLTLAAAGLLLAPSARGSSGRHLFLVAIGVVVAGVVALAIFAVLPVRRLSWRMKRRLVRLRRAARSTARHPLRVAGAYGLALVIQLAFVVLTAVIAGACGLHLPFLAWLFAWPLAKMSAMVPVSQGGIGVREAALAALLVPFGANAGVIVGVGLAWETVVITAALLSGGISLAIGRLPAGQSRAADGLSEESIA